jgi:dTDP-4-dehydrorhamnose reductase
VKIWLTGSGGLLGGAFRDLFERSGAVYVGSGHELDIAQRELVDEFVQHEEPELIVNAAGYTRVDDAEHEEGIALEANALGPENLARAAATVGARLLHFSTDYVFDGKAQAPYRENAACAPLGAYGRTKLEGERRLLAELARGTAVCIVRTSWLFGEHGRNFVNSVVRQLAERDELRVVSDQHGRPTYAPDLAAAALALAKRRATGLFHFANGGETTWHGLACEIQHQAEELGFSLRARRIAPASSAEFARPAPRPAYSVLSTDRIGSLLGAPPRPWREALHDYLQELAT